MKDSAITVVALIGLGLSMGFDVLTSLNHNFWGVLTP